ncbi:Protein BREVIS RADIX [Rhynchospora pubera]|uniref:Protein BREVIS RADIX n=1 Tax=Rhynchospora pubera TaxID=906938 RepID=A0AAV8AK06_9POAL|nr:Protein BREVIS RADIX [Rhynchospora pubera]KAJ4774077.1 Protein BREVIS RADIX [Rhynchospora pubera]
MPIMIKGLSLKVSGVKEQSNPIYQSNQKKIDLNGLLQEEVTKCKEQVHIVTIEEVKDTETVERQDDDEEEVNEWNSEPEPGVFITLVQLPHGGNLLKKISFSKELFDALQAEIWWRTNFEKIVGLYSISEISSAQTPSPSDQENQYGAEESAESSGQGNSCYQWSGSRDDESEEISEKEIDREETAAEWEVEDEPGVYFTLRSLPDGSREGEKFGQVKSIIWWEENKERLEKLYS